VTGSRTDVTAVILTHMRPRLAGDLVRSLIAVEGLDPERVVVVVNGEGGLDVPDLEATVRMVRLPHNLGPAGGFRAGLLEAFADPTTAWAYLCEDDVGLFNLPAPRLGTVLAHVGALGADAARVGAVVAYGRRFTGRSGHSVNTVPTEGSPALVPVDVAAWGATLVSRSVIEAGVLPDPAWFFGYEDFDFFCRVRAAGFAVLVDAEAARRVASEQTSAGRDAALGQHRPTDAEEPWRAYYTARNYFALARRHGTPRWVASHLVYSLRRLQLAHSRAERLATLYGLWDGARGRLGRSERYRRQVGEL
jgi:GT2 family glycosyltransferase